MIVMSDLASVTYSLTIFHHWQNNKEHLTVNHLLESRRLRSLRVNTLVSSGMFRMFSLSHSFSLSFGSILEHFQIDFWMLLECLTDSNSDPRCFGSWPRAQSMSVKGGWNTWKHRSYRNFCCCRCAFRTWWRLFHKQPTNRPLLDTY